MAEPVSSTSPDDLYEQAAAIYDAALDRLARAYEADADKRRDLLQEIHLAMWRSFARYAQHCSMRTWVYQVAHNTAVSHIMRERRTYRGLVTLEEIDNLPATAGDELGGIDRRSALEHLLRLIHSLKPIDRQVILSYLEGMDAASISQITGISPGNVAMKLYRIKDLLARRFQKEGIMASDDIRDLWQHQPHGPVRMAAVELRHKAQVLEHKTRMGLRIAVAIMIFCAIGYASFLYFFPGTIQRIGAALTLAGYVYGFYVLYTRGPARKVPDGPASATCAAYRAELERQRDFHRTAWRTLIVPFVPGPVIFIMGFLIPEQGAAVAVVITAILIASPLAGIPVNRWKAQKLQREIDELQALMKQL